MELVRRVVRVQEAKMKVLQLDAAEEGGNLGNRAFQVRVLKRHDARQNVGERVVGVTMLDPRAATRLHQLQQHVPIQGFYSAHDKIPPTT